MKYYSIMIGLFLIGILFLFNDFSATAGDKHKGYRIEINVPNITDTICSMAFHYGKEIYAKDTAYAVKNKTFVFEGETPLDGGIYVAIFPGNKYFEFLVTEKEQRFTLTTDTTDFVNNLKISKKAKENQLFNKYQRFLQKEQADIRTIQMLLQKTESEDSLILLQDQLKAAQDKVWDYRHKVIDKHPDSFTAQIFRAMKDVDVPEGQFVQEDGSENTPARLQYYKNHFFDHLDFSDAKLLRTPIIYSKVMYYLDKLTVPIPDSVMVSADTVIAKARANEEVFKYVLTKVTGHYERSKIVGMDAVFVHLADKYYLNGEAYWMDSTQLAKVALHVKRTRPNLIGQVAPELVMRDSLNQKVSLHEVVEQNNFTILYFWSYTCGHCKKAFPIFQEAYEKYKKDSIGVYSVCTKIEKKPWLEYIKKQNLYWIPNHVMDPYHKNNFRDLYDIYSTPTIYIMDKDKKIVMKRIGVSQLDEVLERLTKE